jgi:hypothetical protein
MRNSKVWISLFIVLIIGLHAVPVISYQGNRQTGWPILAWAMFARPVPPGPIQVTTRRMYGLTGGARREQITPYLAGMNQSTIGRVYLRPMSQGDTAVAQQLLRRLNHEREDPFIELRVEGETHTLVGDSVVKQAIRPVSYRASRSASQSREQSR